MSTAVMQHPSKPSSSELQYGLHHVARHNADAPFEQDWKPNNDYAQAVQTDSSYVSTGMTQQSSDPFMNEPYGDDQYSHDHNSAGGGLGVRYPGYTGQAGYLSPDDNGYSGSPYVDTFNDAPMTPRSDASLGLRTRSGRSAARSDSPSVLGNQSNSKITKPRAKKSRSNKAVNSKTPKLDAPLSELTKDMDIPVRDMEKWVSRSDAERHQEAEKRNGYITRPMNSFMLYRSAYAERTKQWCTQNNHQVVSSVSGESWPMEPATVREKYNELAKIERENHARAHPSYKFSPSKTPTTTSKKKRNDYATDEDEEDTATDSGDPDWEWRPRNERPMRSRSKRQGREAGYPANNNSVNHIFDAPTYEFDTGMSAYSWETTQRPLPYNVDQFDQYNHFYPVHQQMVPGNHAYMARGIPDSMPTAIPGLGQENMLHADQQFHNGAVGNQVDPTLLSFQEPFEQHGSDHGQHMQAEQGDMPHEFEDAGDLFGQDIDTWTTSAQM